MGTCSEPCSPLRWIVGAISQPVVVTALVFWVGWGNRRGTHPGEICARPQVRIVPGVCGEGRIIVVGHVLTVVEIVFAVVAVVVEIVGVAPIDGGRSGGRGERLTRKVGFIEQAE
jgi:hypothetical protein